MTDSFIASIIFIIFIPHVCLNVKKQEMDSLRNVTGPKKEAYMQSVADLERAEKTVLLGVGDAFARGKVEDIVSLLKRQKERRQRHIDQSNFEVKGTI